MALRRIFAHSLALLVLQVFAYSQGMPKSKGEHSPTASLIPDTTSATNSSSPLSQRVVAYNIEAKYDPKTHSLDGFEVLTYHNLTGQPLDHFPFHLYLNAFQPKATWLREAKALGTRDVTYEKWEDKLYGSDEIKSFEVVGMGDLTSKLEFIQPDDGNKDDKTVVQVVLPKAIAPGEYVQFKIKFHDQFPETRPEPGGSAISFWAASGSPRLACGGTARGIVISSTPRPSSLPISASTMSPSPFLKMRWSARPVSWSTASRMLTDANSYLSRRRHPRFCMDG